MKLLHLSIFFALLFFSCEDVVDIDLPANNPQLVVEANIDCGEDFANCGEQSITLSTSTDFFDDNQFQEVSTASVLLVDLTNATTTPFTYQSNGTYSAPNIDLTSQGGYRLQITYDNDIYTADEQFFVTPPIDSVTQSTDGGFDDEALEINVYFKDAPGVGNYYTLNLYSDKTNEEEAIFDTFFDGNVIQEFFEISETFDEDLEPFEAGDELQFELFANSEQYYNFLSLLLSQSESQGPFPVTPAPLVGNVINTTNPDQKALGYFRIGQKKVVNYTVVAQ